LLVNNQPKGTIHNQMGFFGSILTATVRVVATPLTLAKDVVDVTIGNEPTATINNLDGAAENIQDAFE